MHVERVTWGGLKALLVRESESSEPPRAAIVLCHGFGAPGTDLVGLAEPLMQMEPALGKDVLWVFPAAPLSLDRAGIPGGRAWWPIDMEALIDAVNSGRLRELRNSTPPELPAARDHLLSLLGDLKAATGLGNDRIALGGFSQGAMITTDVSLRLETPPAGLCVLSGTLLCESEWRPLAAQRGKLPVFKSHGTDDPLLPYPNAEALRDLLTESGAEVEFVAFPGEHAIPPIAVKKLGGFLGDIFQNR
jgi:phospholipase/carboxylesterase